jgi:hypothetical protein
LKRFFDISVLVPVFYADHPQHASTPPSFRTEQADFFFCFRSCENVGLRREESLCAFIPNPYQ